MDLGRGQWRVARTEQEETEGPKRAKRTSRSVSSNLPNTGKVEEKDGPGRAKRTSRSVSSNLPCAKRTSRSVSSNLACARQTRQTVSSIVGSEINAAASSSGGRSSNVACPKRTSRSVSSNVGVSSQARQLERTSGVDVQAGRETDEALAKQNAKSGCNSQRQWCSRGNAQRRQLQLGSEAAPTLVGGQVCPSDRLTCG